MAFKGKERRKNNTEMEVVGMRNTQRKHKTGYSYSYDFIL